MTSPTLGGVFLVAQNEYGGWLCAWARTMSEQLTLRNLIARPIVLKLQRPIVARIATMTDWPVILIDLETEEGVVGRSYLEPYLPKAMPYLISAIKDLGEALKGNALLRSNSLRQDARRCTS